MDAPDTRRLPPLITLPPSIASELGRWTLQHYGIAYREKPHGPPFFVFAPWRYFSYAVPVLATKEKTLRNIRAIIDYYEPRVEPYRKLIPDDEAHKAEIEEIWQFSQFTLGAASAAWAYFHLLPHRELMIEPLSRGTPRFEKWFIRNLYPVSAGIMKALLSVAGKNTEERLAQLKEVYDVLDAQLADGRRYLVGDRLTLADVGYAAAGAPTVIPPEYGGAMPPYDQMPPAMIEEVERFRQRDAGQYFLRIYREHRNRLPIPEAG